MNGAQSNGKCSLNRSQVPRERAVLDTWLVMHRSPRVPDGTSLSSWRDSAIQDEATWDCSPLSSCTNCERLFYSLMNRGIPSYRSQPSLSSLLFYKDDEPTSLRALVSLNTGNDVGSLLQTGLDSDRQESPDCPGPANLHNHAQSSSFTSNIRSFYVCRLRPISPLKRYH